MSDAKEKPLAEALAPLLPPGAEPGGRLDEEARGRLEASRRALAGLGFELEVGADALRVHHRDGSFEAVIRLSRPDDLGELRGLFLALRRRFGRLRERWMPWLFLPGPSVTLPYQHLRQIVGTCQRLRQAR